MNEHINDQGLCYCGSLDCVGHLRVMLEKASSEYASVSAELIATRQRADRQAETIEEVKSWVLADIEKGEMSAEEYAEHYEELAEIIGLELTRTVEVVVKIEQTVSVKVPLGTDLNEHDFWVKSFSSEFVDCNYPIENEEDATVEDIEVNE